MMQNHQGACVHTLPATEDNAAGRSEDTRMTGLLLAVHFDMHEVTHSEICITSADIINCCCLLPKHFRHCGRLSAISSMWTLLQHDALRS